MGPQTKGDLPVCQKGWVPCTRGVSELREESVEKQGGDQPVEIYASNAHITTMLFCSLLSSRTRQIESEVGITDQMSAVSVVPMILFGCSFGSECLAPTSGPFGRYFHCPLSPDPLQILPSYNRLGRSSSHLPTRPMSSSDPPPPIARPRPPTFTLLALGTGGGPLETNLSAYLLKPASSAWSGGCVSLEAGSGIGALVELLAKDKVLWRKFGFDELSQDGLPTVGQGEVWQAGKVMQTMRAYLITHA